MKRKYELLFAASARRHRAHQGLRGRDVAPTRYAGSDCADSVAWYAGNSGGTSHKCDGALYPNACGLFDMSGNVGEICNSPYDREARDGRQMACKVVRGGNYSSPAGDVAIDARVPLDQNDTAALVRAAARLKEAGAVPFADLHCKDDTLSSLDGHFVFSKASAEPGGRVYVRIHVRNPEGLDARYNDDRNAARGARRYRTAFKLPENRRNTVELEVINRGTEDTSFVVISN